MCAQTFFTASTRETSGTPTKLWRASDTGTSFIIPVLGAVFFGLVDLAGAEAAALVGFLVEAGGAVGLTVE